MKKLMIVAVAAISAVFAEAAAIDWSASNVVDPWTSETAGKVSPANSWLGYVILDADYATVSSDLANGDTASLITSAVGSPKVSTTKGAFNTSTASGNVAAGDQYFRLIVFNAGDLDNATYFYASDAVQATVDASLDTTVAFLTQKTGTSAKGNWTSMEAIPEPTSGLLMLLGMAGLALRRRRA